MLGWGLSGKGASSAADSPTCTARLIGSKNSLGVATSFFASARSSYLHKRLSHSEQGTVRNKERAWLGR